MPIFDYTKILTLCYTIKPDTFTHQPIQSIDTTS